MKQYLKYYLLGIFLSGHQYVAAQAVDNNGLERSINKERYVRLNYGNDYFTATDYYLTQTIFLEFVHPALKKNPLTRLMFRPAGYEVKYGLAAEHNGYTPTDYVPSQILYGDRPFAGTLSLKSFVIATDTIRKQRIASSLSIGIIGPGAGAGDMQTYIHEHTPNALPQGWHNQIANDLMLNYQLKYEKQLVGLGNYLNIAATGLVKFGTVNTKANVGLTVMTGLLNQPFASFRIKNKYFRLYAYDHPEINIVAYDATLQGGLFNKKSPYTIGNKDVSRVVFGNNWGIVAKVGNVYLEYYQSYLTKEFNSGMDMHNGGIQVGVGF